MSIVKLPYKGYARLFVKNVEDVKVVESVLQDLDYYEYNTYYSNNLVTTLDNYSLVYTGKYELPEGFEKAMDVARVDWLLFTDGVDFSDEGVCEGKLDKFKNTCEQLYKVKLEDSVDQIAWNRVISI